MWGKALSFHLLEIFRAKISKFASGGDIFAKLKLTDFFMAIANICKRVLLSLGNRL